MRNQNLLKTDISLSYLDFLISVLPSSFQGHQKIIIKKKHLLSKKHPKAWCGFTRNYSSQRHMLHVYKLMVTSETRLELLKCSSLIPFTGLHLIFLSRGHGFGWDGVNSLCRDLYDALTFQIVSSIPPATAANPCFCEHCMKKHSWLVSLF